MSNEIFVRNKRLRGPNAPRGRLFVGRRKTDWSKVYYEPISTAEGDEAHMEDNEGAADIALFRYEHGEAGYREPMHGEVYWEPHYDPKTFLADGKKEKDLMMKRFVHDCYIYCAERDPVRSKTIEDRFLQQDTRNMRWVTWLEMAMAWKKKDLGVRGRRRGNREETVRAAGINPRDLAPAELNSDTSDSDDEGYGDDGQEGLGRRGSMGPPPTPKRKGSGSGTNGQKAKRSKNGTNGAGSPTPDRSRQSSALFMSGGLGSPPSNRARSAYSPGVDGDDLGSNDSDQESHDWDDDHPEPGPAPRPGPRPRAPDGLGGAAAMESPGPLFGARRHDGARTPTPSARSPTSPNAPARHREPSHTPNRTFRPNGDRTNGASSSSAGGRRLGGGRPGTQPGGGQGMFGNAQNIADLDDEPDADDENINVNPVRGGTAQRESAARSRAHSAVDEFNGPGVDDEEAVRQLIRATAPPDDVNDQNRPPSGEQGSPNDVHRSIEDGEDEDDLLRCGA
ncbi:hypothetical protein LTR15_002678 [Elasticomyces elasticus]|nr:hypothetical protein LTR15_002678 [Elasticomyces elasticus]